jgi:hypothetical protein
MPVAPGASWLAGAAQILNRTAAMSKARGSPVGVIGLEFPRLRV